MKITFHGAAGTVTGSKYLLDTDDARLLIDCGLFQGLKQLRLQNWEPPPFDLGTLDAVVLTHAHVDHSGWLPLLARRGWRGPIWCTPGTADLVRILLPDAAYLQEEDARFANLHGYSKHRPALPLFDRDDAEAALALVRTVPYGKPFTPAKGVSARFVRAGHIVGAARVEIDGRLVFSGDVGRPNDLLLLPPDHLDTAEVLVVESTYGGRHHDRRDPAETLAGLLRPALDRGGVVMVPTFAVGRAQEVLHLIATLKADGRIPDVPVFLDSPMAIHATRIYCDHVEDHRLTHPACKALCATATALPTREDSMTLNDRKGPFIVLAGSGMAAGGRILHHLARRAEDPRNAVLLVGFQAAGTRGQAILAGAERVKIHGRYVDVRAERLRIDSLSAHADEEELVAWLGTLKDRPRRVFLTHGEPAAADALRVRLKDAFGWDAEIPTQGQAETLW
ncbi:MAG: MBL fold metallo-hydrolase RNA specificity domain-containing protein [Myxococcota bacterium]